MDTFEFISTHDFRTALVHCLTAEKMEEYLWNWMQADFTLIDTKDRKLYWKALVLKNTVTAQAYWTDKGDVWGVAIQSYLRARETRREKTQDDPKYIPPFQAGEWRCSQLSKTDNHAISSTTFDEFVRSLWWEQPAKRRHHVANLMLSHPSGSDPTAALAFWRWTDTKGRHDPYAKDLYAPIARSAMYHVF